MESYEGLPLAVIEAVLASEDNRMTVHPGLSSFKHLFRP